VAVVGAAPEVRVDGNGARSGQVLALAEGQVLEVGPLRAGCRTYVSVAGGFLGPVPFGSGASDELSGLGPGPLVPGCVMHAGPWAPPLGDHVAPGSATELEPGVTVGLRVVPGPHPERFAPDALARMGETVFVVERDSNRVGIRLRPEDDLPGLHRAGADGGTGAGELDSHGVVTGAVQVPPDGNPVVLLSDHATLGGYPVLAVVASVDHGKLGQCSPGTRVRLVTIGEADAREAWRSARRALERAVVGHHPLAAG
jgi:allophanate hydrolase subunit 2